MLWHCSHTHTIIFLTILSLDNDVDGSNSEVRKCWHNIPLNNFICSFKKYWFVGCHAILVKMPSITALEKMSSNLKYLLMWFYVSR